METTISISFVGMRRGEMEKYLKSSVILFCLVCFLYGYASERDGVESVGEEGG